MPNPRMDSLEPRRLFAFTSTGASTITGSDFQEIEHVVPINGGIVSAGLFGAGTNFGNGVVLDSRGRSDVFITVTKGTSSKTLAIGGESRLRLKFRKDRVDFAASPRRIDESFQFGVSAEARRADEYVSQMKIGPDGKLYVALLFRRSISLNTQNPKGQTLNATGGFEDEFFDSAILRFNVSGTTLALEKTIQIGGPFNDLVNDFAFDGSGNLLVSGSFERRCDFDPTKGSKLLDPNGRGDAFVAKYSTSGKLQWVAQLGGDSARETESESGFSVTAAADGGAFVGGTFAGDADFKGSDGKNIRKIAKGDKLTDAFTMRVSSTGKLDWVKVQGGNKFDGIKAVTAAPDGGVYSVGYFEGDADLDPSDHEQTFTANKKDASSDLFFTHFDSDGKALFIKPLSGSGFELIAGASTAKNGDLVIAGSFFGTFDVDPSKRTHNLQSHDGGIDDGNQTKRDQLYAGFAAVYSPDAKLRRSTQIDAVGEEDVFVTGAALGANDNLYLGGRYLGGLAVAGKSIVKTVGSGVKNYREDGFAMIFNGSLKPIV